MFYWSLIMGQLKWVFCVASVLHIAVQKLQIYFFWLLIKNLGLALYEANFLSALGRKEPREKNRWPLSLHSLNFCNFGWYLAKPKLVDCWFKFYWSLGNLERWPCIITKYLGIFDLVFCQFCFSWIGNRLEWGRSH